MCLFTFFPFDVYFFSLDTRSSPERSFVVVVCMKWERMRELHSAYFRQCVSSCECFECCTRHQVKCTQTPAQWAIENYLEAQNRRDPENDTRACGRKKIIASKPARRSHLYALLCIFFLFPSYKVVFNFFLLILSSLVLFSARTVYESCSVPCLFFKKELPRLNTASFFSLFGSLAVYAFLFMPFKHNSL